MNGICFKEWLFHATIEGRKTQTRRIANPQPNTCGSCYSYIKSDYKYIGGGRFCYTKGYKINDSDIVRGCYDEYCKPRYKVGETVYLKEPYWFEKDISLVFFKWKKLSVL